MIPKTLSHYEVLEKIGSGGMGEVYLARDTLLDRQVAIKVLPEKVSSDELQLARFEREAKAIAALNHPNIVTIYSVEESDGQRFFTMELVKGRALDELIPKQGIELEQFFELSIPLSDAIATAHGKGITHRDLKPANVMLNEEGRIKVLDFGLARLLEPDAELEVTQETPARPLTEEGFVVGTFPYMSPEQIEGKPLDHRTDLFSLGVILYQLTTGERPFQGNSSAAIISSVLKDTPTSISRIRSEIPLRLESIIERCLEKDVSRRYASASEIRDDLEELKRDITSSITRSSTTASSVSKQRQMVVVLPFENMGPVEDGYFAEGITEEIISRLSAVRDLGVISRTTATQYERTGKTVKQIGRDLGVDYVVEGTVRWARASGGQSRVRITPQLVRAHDDTNLWTERYDHVIDDIFEIQSDIAEKVIDQLGITLLDSEREALGAKPTDNLQAYEAYLKGRALGTSFLKEPLLKGIEWYEKAIELDPNFMEAYVSMSMLHSHVYFLQYDESEARRKKARQAADRALELAPNSYRPHLALGYYHYHAERDFDAAEKELAIAEQGQPNDADILAARGFVQRRQGRWDSAMANLDRAMILNPKAGREMWNHAADYSMLRKYDRALALYDRAIELLPNEPVIYCLKARSYLQWTGSLEDMRRTLDDVPAEFHSDPWCKLEWYSLESCARNPGRAFEIASGSDWEGFYSAVWHYPKFFLMGVARLRLGEKDLAVENLEAARLILEAQCENHPTHTSIQSTLAMVHAYLGDEDAARKFYMTAEELMPMSADAVQAPAILFHSAWALSILGKVEEALQKLDKVLSVPSWYSATAIELDPCFDPLRDHPRYKELIRKYS